MKVINIDRYVCDHCGHKEDVDTGSPAKIISIKVGTHEKQWCPDCVHEIWPEHVNLEDLRGFKGEDEKKEVRAKEESKRLVLTKCGTHNSVGCLICIPVLRSSFIDPDKSKRAKEINKGMGVVG